MFTTTRVVGTGQYVGPEVHTQGNSRASDMFAFGVLLDEVWAFAEQAGAVLPAMQSLVKLACSVDPLERPTAASLLQNPLLQVREPRRTCITSLETLAVSQGIECGGAHPHFLSAAGFSGHIITQCTPSGHVTLGAIQARKGLVFCPNRALKETDPDHCKAPAYEDSAVARVASSDAFKLYTETRVKLAETVLAKKMEGDKRRAIDSELKRLLAMDADQRRVAAGAMQVVLLLVRALSPQAFLLLGEGNAQQRMPSMWSVLRRFRCVFFAQVRQLPRSFLRLVPQGLRIE